MNSLWTKLKAWFVSEPRTQPKETKTPLIPQPIRPVKPFRPKHYHRLIKKLTRQMRKNEKQRRLAC